jgi:adenylate cyclase
MRYNMACAYIQLDDVDAALNLLEPLFESLSVELVNWSKTDADLDPIRDHPRFRAMLKRAEDRLSGTT